MGEGHTSGTVIVALENHLGDVQYEFQFDDSAVAAFFAAAVETQAATAELKQSKNNWATSIY